MWDSSGDDRVGTTGRLDAFLGRNGACNCPGVALGRRYGTIRDLTGQARGILMDRYPETCDVAFSVPARESKNSKTKLRVVAENLCATGRLPSEMQQGSQQK